MRKIVYCKQRHSANVAFVDTTVKKTGQLFENTDGMVTDRNDIALLCYGADCCIIAFWDDTKHGICHSGWKGLVGGIIETMRSYFSNQTHVFIGPFLHQFQIKKDDCYDQLMKAGLRGCISEKDDEIIFDFKKAIIKKLSGCIISMDPRSTSEHPELASWRRDQLKGSGTQNRLVVWRNKNNEVETKVFPPKHTIALD